MLVVWVHDFLIMIFFLYIMLSFSLTKEKGWQFTLVYMIVNYNISAYYYINDYISLYPIIYVEGIFLCNLYSMLKVYFVVPYTLCWRYILTGYKSQNLPVVVIVNMNYNHPNHVIPVTSILYILSNNEQ